MARLDRRLTVQHGNQKIHFKFKANAQGDREVDLEADGAVRNGMLKAFVRAKEAATIADAAFSGATWNFERRTIAGLSTHALDVVSEFFRDPQQPEQLDAIRKTFAAIKAGLLADVTLSDMEPLPGAEGVVNPRTKVGGGKLMDDLVARSASQRKTVEDELQADSRYSATYAKGLKQHEILVQLGSDNLRSIHLAFSYCREKSVDYVARVIVHEASHKFGKTGDIAYSFDRAFRAMPPALAVINADSYAFAALSLLRNEVLTDSILGDETAAIRDKAAPRGFSDTALVSTIKRKLPESRVWFGFIPY